MDNGVPMKSMAGQASERGGCSRQAWSEEIVLGGPFARPGVVVHVLGGQDQRPMGRGRGWPDSLWLHIAVV